MRPFIAKYTSKEKSTKRVVVLDREGWTFLCVDTYDSVSTKSKKLWHADMTQLEFIEWVRMR